MSVNISSLVAEAKAVVNEATSLTDLADKWADRVRPLLAGLPTVGPEASVVIVALDTFDKALHAVKNVVDAL